MFGRNKKPKIVTCAGWDWRARVAERVSFLLFEFFIMCITIFLKENFLSF